MSSSEPVRRVDQLVVGCLAEIVPRERSELLDVRARARSLPTMLRRHGPVQVLLFLAAKDDADRKLGTWLLDGIATVLPEAGEHKDKLDGYAGFLATVPLERYLLHWQTAVEVAGWLKRLVEARCPQDRSSGGPTGG